MKVGHAWVVAVLMASVSAQDAQVPNNTVVLALGEGVGAPSVTKVTFGTKPEGSSVGRFSGNIPNPYSTPLSESDEDSVAVGYTYRWKRDVLVVGHTTVEGQANLEVDNNAYGACMAHAAAKVAYKDQVVESDGQASAFTSSSGTPVTVGAGISFLKFGVNFQGSWNSLVGESQSISFDDSDTGLPRCAKSVAVILEANGAYNLWEDAPGLFSPPGFAMANYESSAGALIQVPEVCTPHKPK